MNQYDFFHPFLLKNLNNLFLLYAEHTLFKQFTDVFAQKSCTCYKIEPKWHYLEERFEGVSEVTKTARRRQELEDQFNEILADETKAGCHQSLQLLIVYSR
jgi:hypothetical protein